MEKLSFKLDTIKLPKPFKSPTNQCQQWYETHSYIAVMIANHCIFKKPILIYLYQIQNLIFLQFVVNIEIQLIVRAHSVL